MCFDIEKRNLKIKKGLRYQNRKPFLFVVGGG
jgi:hypothetical protein